MIPRLPDGGGEDGAVRRLPVTPIINKMWLNFFYRSWILDVLCTQHLERRVRGCKTHLNPQVCGGGLF